MVYNEVIPVFDFVGTVGFLFAVKIGIENYRATDVEQPFWLVFTFTAALGSVWLTLVTIEWLGISSAVMDLFSTSLQAVVIGLFAVAVVGMFPIVQDLKASRVETIKHASIVSIRSRVLRHNLRNDLTVIRGYASMLRDDSDEVDQIEAGIDGLIATSEKARKLEQAVSSQPRRSSVNLYELVQRITDDIKAAHPDASFEMTGPTDITAAVPQSLEIAIEELIENAAKHTGGDPQVEITISRADARISVKIVDDGPGIPEHERELLNEDIETSLLHSNGIGLWLTRWIVENQAGTIAAGNLDDGAGVTITLPVAEGSPAHDQTPPETDITHGYDRYNAIFENDVDGILVVDDDHRILDANQRAGDLLDVSANGLLGQALDGVISGGSTVVKSLDEMASGEISSGTVSLSSDAADAVWMAQSDIVIGEHLVVIREISQHTDLL